MINWKERLRKDGTVDLQGMPYYHLKWDKNSEVIDLYEYKVFVPCAPPDELCVNYGLSIDDQIWRNTWIPKQVKNPKKDYGRESWSQREIEAFIDAEWNRRTQGLWIFIKGIKTYVPGLLYLKMNYWKNDKKIPFIYKHSDWEFFMFWLHCLYDPSCKGMVDFKCRQVGATENAIIIMWEYGSRVRGAMCVNQSCINENHAIQTYKRLVNGHKNMIYYFRPLNQGTEDPKKGLRLSYPAQHITFSSIKGKSDKGELVNRSSKEEYEYPEIGSEFKYGPSKSNEFDGYTLGRAYLDEFAKSDGKINPVEWIQVIKEATYSNILGRKMGMILMTSTAEEIGPDSLDWAKAIWRESDPNKRTPNGSTTNGLYRCFRNVVARGEVDKWGFPMKDKIISEIQATSKAMIEAGNSRGAISYKRKNPITIEDVFMSATTESQFHIENLQKREYVINEQMSPKPFVKGNLKWRDDIKDTEVIWEPNPNGRWIISKHPSDYGLQSNAKSAAVFSPKPANTHYFCAGVDPIDQSDTLDSEPSNGAICLMRKPDEMVDNNPDLYYQFNDEIKGIQKGMPVNLGANFETNRVCCTYMDRPSDTNEFFEDVIMTMVYYGSDFLPEKNKFGGLHSYLKTRGYELYLMDRPTDVKNYKGQSEKDGVTATVDSINMYFGFITSYTCNMANALDHPDLIAQLLTMNYKNKTKRDLGVAFGWCLYASMQRSGRLRNREEDNKDIIHFHENYV